jgi:hypothetical protein
VVLLGLGGYVGWSIFIDEQSEGALLTRTVTGKAAGPESSPIDLTQLRQPLAAYVASITQRSPFTGTEAEKPAVQAQAAQPLKTARQKLQEMVRNLVIVGIDHGEHPQAIIEDVTQRRTHFLQVGDNINGLAIVEISQQGIVVAYEGEELVLQ